MPITLARDDLAQALGVLARVVERRNTIPIVSNVLIDAVGDVVTLTATDLDIEVEATIRGETSAPCDFTLPAHTLHDVVKKLPGGASVTLEPEADGARVALRSGRLRYALNALPAADFPDIPQPTEGAAYTLPAGALAQALGAVSFAMSTEETRFYLNGVFLHVVEIDGAPMLTFAATDGHRLARWRLPAPAGAEVAPGVIVPRKAIIEIARLAKEARGADARLAIDAEKLRLTIGDATLTTKLIDGTFPDYQRVIPTGNDKTARLRREDLAQAADRVATVSSERGKAVRLAFDATTLALSVDNAGIGSSREEIDCDFDSDPLEIGFNAAYLRDALQAAGGEQTLMRLDNAGAPALIANPDDDALTIVLMPMRV